MAEKQAPGGEGSALISITITNLLTLAPLNGIPGRLVEQIQDRLTFDNPAYLEAQKRGFSTWTIAQEIKEKRG